MILCMVFQEYLHKHVLYIDLFALSETVLDRILHLCVVIGTIFNRYKSYNFSSTHTFYLGMVDLII